MPVTPIKDTSPAQLYPTEIKPSNRKELTCLTQSSTFVEAVNPMSGESSITKFEYTEVKSFKW